MHQQTIDKINTYSEESHPIYHVSSWKASFVIVWVIVPLRRRRTIDDIIPKP